MAAPQRSFCCIARRSAPQRSLYRTRPGTALCSQLPPSTNSFHTTALCSQPRSRPAAQRIPIPRSRVNADAPPVPSFPLDLNPNDQNYYRNASEQERADFKAEYELMEKTFNDPDFLDEMDAEINRMAEDVENDLGSDSIPTPKIRQGLLNMGEEDELGDEEDEEFEGDDISSLAHGDLEQHREIREYARIAAWEMPLLSKLAIPFEPPGQDQPLRFRYTTYMGETHPAAKKVVLEFCPGDLPLSNPAHRLKLIKLCGVRYNPRQDLVKMSCEMFETQAQNKRYLGDLVDILMDEAQKGDTFEDVPVDFRHVNMSQKPVFPMEWGLGNEERREALRRGREEREEKERERMMKGLVNGGALIEAALRARVDEKPKEASKVLSQRSVSGAKRGRYQGLRLR